ncbi:Colicin immunity protein [Cupriavidus sp. H19C3]
MKLAAGAAEAICNAAEARGLLVTRVEGGIWHYPGFEARIDCIWDGADPPVSRDEAVVNNRAARDFISEEKSEHDTFVITALRFAS